MKVEEKEGSVEDGEGEGDHSKCVKDSKCMELVVLMMEIWQKYVKRQKANRAKIRQNCVENRAKIGRFRVKIRAELGRKCGKNAAEMRHVCDCGDTFCTRTIAATIPLDRCPDCYNRLHRD